MTNKIALIFATVIFLMFPCAAMADKPGKILDRLPETVEDLEQYEGIEIPLDEAVENIVQLRNIGDLYDDVKFTLLCRTSVKGKKYEIYSVEMDFCGVQLRKIYLLMYDGKKKYPKALNIHISWLNCRKHFLIRDNIIDISYIIAGEFPILVQEFYNLDNMKLIKSNLHKGYYSERFYIEDDSEDSIN